MQFVERIVDISGNVEVNQQWFDTCSKWDEYQTKLNPRRDDSGV